MRPGRRSIGPIWTIKYWPFAARTCRPPPTAPSRLFLGDVGSVPLGYLLGSLLIGAAAGGQWAAAVVLPLYYLADASLTLVRRAWRRERLWRAHREHFYQRAVQRGFSHAAVALRVLACNVLLVGLALVVSVAPGAALRWSALLLALLAVGILLAMLARQAPPPRSEEHTSELQSLMRISYAVFCLKKKRNIHNSHTK